MAYSCVFDPVKLKWMNGQYIKSYPLAEITKLIVPYLEAAGLPLKGLDPAWLEKAVDLARPYLETLADAPKHMRPFFEDKFEIEADAAAIQAEVTFAPVADALKLALGAHVASAGDALTSEEFAKIQDQVKTSSGAKGKGLFMPMRVALTGQAHGPDLKLVVPLLGAKRALARVEHVLSKGK
jgi:nondiscriminating glutamyl-tRNA synthetase